MRLNGHLIKVDDLTARQRDEMYELMVQYYENMNRSIFDSDLDEKHWIICCTDPKSGVIRGFSTQMLLHVESEGGPVCALFSGDTIVDRMCWAQNSLAKVWGSFVLSLMDRFATEQFYWFLIAKGYKTYRFLPVFFHEFYPRYDERTPGWASEVIATLGSHKYPREYDQDTGIIRALERGCSLRSNVAEITDQRMKDPHVSFFADRNPGHARGDEICCIAPLRRENFTRAAYRVIGTEQAMLAELL